MKININNSVYKYFVCVKEINYKSFKKSLTWFNNVLLFFYKKQYKSELKLTIYNTHIIIHN